MARIALVAAATIILAAGTRAADKRPVSLEDSVSLRGVGAPQISPDGTRVLVTVRAWEWVGGKAEPDKGSKAPEIRSHIWMVAAGGGEPARQVTFGDKGETSPAWSPDGRYISFTATRGAGAAGSADAAAPTLGDRRGVEGRHERHRRQRIRHPQHQLSGLSFVDRVTTPLLIMHGMHDERVPIGQAMEFYRALKDRGKTVELVWYPREGHSFSEYYHQRDQIRREFEWINKYTLGAAKTSTSQQ